MIVSFDVFAYSTLLLHVKVKHRYKKNGYHTALLIVKLHIVSFLPRSLSIDNIRHDVTYLSTWLLHERWRKKTTYIYQYIYLWYMYTWIVFRYLFQILLNIIFITEPYNMSRRWRSYVSPGLWRSFHFCSSVCRHGWKDNQDKTPFNWSLTMKLL